MRHFVALLLPLFMAVTSLAHARMVGNVDLPDTLNVNQTRLVLNGAGIRNKYYVDVYVAGIYLPEISADAPSIVSANEVQSMRLVVISSLVTRDRLLEPIQDAVRKSAGSDYPKFEPLIKELWDTFNFEVHKGDTLEFTWVPGSGTQVSMNGKMLRVLPEHDFKKMLFGLWLSQNPVQESLKQDLLGAVR